MRTTMNLPDALMSQVRQRAAAEGRTVTSVVEQALQELLLRHEERRPQVQLPVWGNPDDEPLVELTPQTMREIEEQDEIERFLQVERQRR